MVVTNAVCVDVVVWWLRMLSVSTWLCGGYECCLCRSGCVVATNVVCVDKVVWWLRMLSVSTWLDVFTV